MSYEDSSQEPLLPTLESYEEHLLPVPDGRTVLNRQELCEVSSDEHLLPGPNDGPVLVQKSIFSLSRKNTEHSYNKIQQPKSKHPIQNSEERTTTDRSSNSIGKYFRKKHKLNDADVVEVNLAFPLREAVNSLQGNPGIQTKHHNNEINAFGQSVIAQLKKLPEEYQIECIEKIQNIITKTRLKNLNFLLWENKYLEEIAFSDE